MSKYGFRNNELSAKKIEVTEEFNVSKIVYKSDNVSTVTPAGTVAKVVAVEDASGSTFYMPLHRER